jgi:hypothetical protein
VLERLSNVWSKYSPTDGPGHTDHPKVDIETHRSIARTLKWLGITGAIAAGIGANGDQTLVVGGVALFAVGMLASLDLRLRALEWEVQLDDE